MSKIERNGLNEYKLFIDFDPKSRFANLKLKQYNTYQLKVYLTCNDLQQSLDSDNDYYLRVQLPDGEKILIKNTLAERGSSSNSSLKFYIGPEITKYPGLHRADIGIYRIKASLDKFMPAEVSYDGIVSTQMFIIEVISAPDFIDEKNDKIDLTNKTPIISFSMGNLWRGLEGIDDKHYYTIKIDKYIYKRVTFYHPLDQEPRQTSDHYIEYITKGWNKPISPANPIIIEWYTAGGDWWLDIGTFFPYDQYSQCDIYEEGLI